MEQSSANVEGKYLSNEQPSNEHTGFFCIISRIKLTHGECSSCVSAFKLCDCNKKSSPISFPYKSCCYIYMPHRLGLFPPDVKMEIIDAMKKSHESRLSTPCDCFRIDCCWLQTFPDDLKMLIIKRRRKVFFHHIVHKYK